MKQFFLTFLFCLFSLEAIAKESIHVAYNIDDNYVIYMLLSINSILKNNKSDSEYTFWILENKLSEKNKKMIRTYIEERHQKINFLSPHQNALYTPLLPLIKNIYTQSAFSHVSFVSFMRLFIPSLLPDDVHKVIYIDGDTLIVQDLKELFQTDLGEYSIGMVKDISQNLATICQTNAYYNAGVILINTDKWKKNNTLDKLFFYFTENPEKYKLYGEQDLLNCLLNNDIMTLDAKWNNQIFRHLSSVELNNTGIFHYLSKEKPWNTFEVALVQKPYRLYLSYWNSSGLRRYKYKEIYNRIKTTLPLEEWNELKKYYLSKH